MLSRDTCFHRPQAKRSGRTNRLLPDYFGRTKTVSLAGSIYSCHRLSAFDSSFKPYRQLYVATWDSVISFLRVPITTFMSFRAPRSMMVSMFPIQGFTYLPPACWRKIRTGGVICGYRYHLKNKSYSNLQIFL